MARAKKIESMAETELKLALSADGYDPLYAEEVRRAAANGTLLWTREHLVTTDASRLSLRPNFDREVHAALARQEAEEAAARR